MKYKELEKIAEDNGYKIKDDEKFLILTKHIGNIIKISKSIENVIFPIIDVCLPSDFQMLKASLKYAETPLEERQEEKRYIIPLPHLTTCDGEQLFLTHQGNFFPCRRNKGLRQTWKEKDLIHIPEEYRDFAIEIEVEE